MKNTKETRQGAALLLSFIYLGITFTNTWMSPVNILVFLPFPLFFIFFSEKAAEFVGQIAITGKITRMTKKSPAEVAEMAGWIILLLPVIVYLIT